MPIRLSLILVLFIIASPGGAAASPSIRLGLIAPLTGPFADWGQSIRRGVEIAVSDSPVPFAVEYQDDRCQPAQTVAKAQRFFGLEGIRYIIGPGCDHCLLAIADLARKHDAILFSSGLLAEDVFVKHSNVVNLATQISSEAKRLAARIAQDGVKRLGLVHGTNTFGQEYKRRLMDELRSRAIEAVSEGVDLGETDYRSVLVRLLGAAPDAIFIHQGEQEIIAFITQLRVLDKSLPVYSQYGFETESIRDAAGPADGVTYTYPLNSQERSSARQDFDRRFHEQFGANALPSATSYYVYDGLMLLAEALGKCGDNSACVREHFASLGQREGISGTMTFRKDGGLDRHYGIKRLLNGRFQWLSREPG